MRFIVSKTILYLNTDTDAVNAKMLMPRFPRGPLHVDELKFSRGKTFIPGWIYFRLHGRVENKNISTRAELKNTIRSMFIRHDIYMKTTVK